GREASRPVSALALLLPSHAARLRSADCSFPLPRASRKAELLLPRASMSALGQKHVHPTHQLTKAQKYFDLELRATSAQRSSFALSKTSFSPERGQRNRGLSASHP